jgi:threonine dehydrogenase-like Zn-dependent dehydrogenase
MKAIRVTNMQSNPAITIVDIEQPAIQYPYEVLIRVLAVGLDGTDREILTEKYGMPPEGEDALTTGHESLGIVIEAGDATGFKQGDLVTAIVRRPCHEQTCVNCRNGHADFCESGHYVERGIKGAHGFLSEYYIEDARYLVQVPKSALSYGMLAEPQSIVEKVWDQIGRVQQRLIWEPRTVLILGSGPLGLLAAMTCRALDLNVYVWSMSPEDSEQAHIAQNCGAVYQRSGGVDALSGAEGDKLSTLTQFAERLGTQFDFIMECTGFSPLAFEAMSILGPNGVLALLGVTPGNRKLEVPADVLNQSMVLENKCVIGSVNASRKDFETGLYRLRKIEEKFPGQLNKLITNRLTLEEVPTLDFSKISVKAVVDVVPEDQWDKLVKQPVKVEYSFSV